MVVEKDSFKLPEVTRFNPDDHRSYLQLVDFYNYVKNCEHLIEEWRGKASWWDEYATPEGLNVEEMLRSLYPEVWEKAEKCEELVRRALEEVELEGE